VEFYPYQSVPAAAVEAGKKLMAAGGLDVVGSSIWRRGTAAGYSMTSTQIQISAPLSRKHSVSIHSNEWWIS
jgi:hypothetical protein